MKKRISNAVIRRLPKYHRYLDNLYKQGITRISSHMLAENMGLTASQIRQDLNCFGGFGQQGYGYNVSSLHNEIAEILGLKTVRKAILLGAGNLGRALIRNFNFSSCGFDVIAAFDVSESVGSQINNIPVYHIDAVEEFIEREQPYLAILTLPTNIAQETAFMLEKCGIRGIWNFTNFDLSTARSDVQIENVHFGDSLMTLSYKLRDSE